MARYIDVGKLLKELTVSPDGTRIPDVDCDNFPIKVDLRLLKRIILRQPLADVVEVKHGEWLDNHNGTFVCSVCRGKSPRKRWCGDCGAKMDGGKEE